MTLQCRLWLLLSLGQLILLPSICSAQGQAAGAVLAGEGAFLRGAGWYNLNTSKANSIDVNSMIRWKQDLRKIAAEKRELQARKAAGSKVRQDEWKRLLQNHEQQLRVNPSAEDVQNGQALNVLLYDLTDPDITLSQWASGSVPLPKEISVRELVFQFTRQSSSPNASKALGSGLIAISRLDVQGDQWPIYLKQPELAKERVQYEKAYAKLRDQLIAGKFEQASLQNLDRSLEALSADVVTAIPEERGFRSEAEKYVKDLTQATRMFDAATVEYAREILIDTKAHNATTVGELVAFMLKYRLQFANAGRSAVANDMHKQIFEAMRQQVKAFDLKPTVETVGLAKDAGPFQASSVWVGEGKTSMKLTVTDRTKDTFHARFEIGANIVRELTGTIKDNKVAWLAKDTKATKGGAGANNHGVISSDGNGNKIDFVWREPKGKKGKKGKAGADTGTFTLRLK